MKQFSGIMVRSTNPPTVEIDPSCHSAYIRFEKGKVERTISQNAEKTSILVDVDAKNTVLGVELVGVREFSIAALRAFLPSNLKSGVDFSRARFMPAAEVCNCRENQAVLA